MNGNELFFSHWGLLQWGMAALAAFIIGLSKSGWGGLGMLTVIIMASLMKGQEKESTGVVLPLLIAADFMAVRAFRGHADWGQIVRILPPAALGVVIGYFLMGKIDNASFKPLIGLIVIVLIALQLIRQRFPAPFAHLPQSRTFAWSMGIAAGVTTMIANAAGPVMGLYFLAIGLGKWQLVGTGAWYFLIVNLFKVPFSAQLGLIDARSLLFNLWLFPMIVLGIFCGRALLGKVDQTLFERLVLVMAAISALHLLL